MSRTKQEKIVLDFIDAYRVSWPPDLAAALEPLAEDAYYQIVVPTIPPVRGRAQILAEHQLMKERVLDQKHEMKAWGSHGNTVFTERVDYSLRNNKWTPIPASPYICCQKCTFDDAVQNGNRVKREHDGTPSDRDG